MMFSIVDGNGSPVLIVYAISTAIVLSVLLQDYEYELKIIESTAHRGNPVLDRYK